MALPATSRGLPRGRSSMLTLIHLAQTAFALNPLGVNVNHVDIAFLRPMVSGLRRVCRIHLRLRG